ncbi:MAG: hypothetical protein E7287_05055 [Lachnospiraceae bacterium]|nr:hypothetical protein [Lachnospiraceae bacterium]
MGFFNEGPVIQQTRVGDIITASVEAEDGLKEIEKYKVTEVHPHLVIGVANRGQKKRVFSFGDLVMFGYESAFPEGRKPLPERIRKKRVSRTVTNCNRLE